VTAVLETQVEILHEVWGYYAEHTHASSPSWRPARRLVRPCWTRRSPTNWPPRRVTSGWLETRDYAEHAAFEDYERRAGLVDFTQAWDDARR
jgi:hypothetical protein